MTVLIYTTTVFGFWLIYTYLYDIQIHQKHKQLMTVDPTDSQGWSQGLGGRSSERLEPSTAGALRLVIGYENRFNIDLIVIVH